jgi:predicted Zn-dependent protease
MFFQKRGVFVIKKLVSCVTLIFFLNSMPCYALFGPGALTVEEEKKMGREFIRYVRNAFEIIEDPAIHTYIQKLGSHIAAQFPDAPFQFRFYVIKEDVYNAFAGPGGYIFVNSGLLAAMDSEDQLAGILAHEIAHVYRRHISQRLERSQKIGMATMAGILAGIFLGGGAAAGVLPSAAGQQLSLNYSRENEMEADQVGLKYLIDAGYGGEGLLRILKKMREKQWFGSNQIPSYLQTHPAIEDRMGYLDTWLQAHPQWRKRSDSTPQGDFAKVRIKLIAAYVSPDVARNTLDAMLSENPHDVLALYGKGVLLDREGNRIEALQYLQKAIELRPFDGDILRDLGKVRFHSGDYAQALQNLQAALAYNRDDLEGQFLLGRAQTMTGDFQRAVETFEGLLQVSPGYFPALYHMGEAYSKLGNALEAHYNLGMYYKYKGPIKNARFHLERALKLSAGYPDKKEKIQKELTALPKPKKDDSGNNKGKG